jgi:hypothetical protein
MEPQPWWVEPLVAVIVALTGYFGGKKRQRRIIAKDPTNSYTED